MGGAERALTDLVTRLAADRFAPVVSSLQPCPRGPARALVQELHAAGIPVEFLNARVAMQAPAVIWSLVRWLRRHQPTILQTFLFHANAVGAVAGRLAGVPNVVTGIRVAERRPNLHHWVTRRTARWVRYHVCASQAVADFARQTGGLPADRLVVIPSGIDPARYRARAPARLTDLGVPAGRRAMLYAGRLVQQKGVDWLLERAVEILACLPDHDLLLVGRGPEQPRLERLAANLGIRRRVHFAGWHAHLIDIMRASDLVVLTSRWEGMPRVVLEAMASGRPVVATEVEGVAELLGEQAPGQLVPALDGAAFVAAVVALARNQRLAAEIGRGNERRAAEAFPIARTVAAYGRLYQSLIDRPAGVLASVPITKNVT
ncbi:MAG: hypothetical protein A2W31_12690 [Planctomycetes bacterium RBG_16_64_10]|nr:MAG: hypothetical protein A2W31_12690 [Planctomycetes bacterium RBG_16_64_10]